MAKPKNTTEDVIIKADENITILEDQKHFQRKDERY